MNRLTFSETLGCNFDNNIITVSDVDNFLNDVKSKEGLEYSDEYDKYNEIYHRVGFPSTKARYNCIKKEGLKRGTNGNIKVSYYNEKYVNSKGVISMIYFVCVESL